MRKSSRKAVLRGRGAVLAASVVTLVVSACAALPVQGVTRVVEAYGGLSTQEGQWWLPRGQDLPVVVLIHGGYWSPGYDRGLEDPVAGRLSAEGFAVFNIDYRPAGGTWSDTFVDVGQAVDSVATSAHADQLDLDRVAVVGHSAGGHLALWAGSRAALPSGAPGADPAVVPALVVAQAPVADLSLAHDLGLGGGAVEALLQGDPSSVPERYAVTDPSVLVSASSAPSVLLHGGDDDVVPLSVSEAYVTRARSVGARAELVEVSGGHFAHIKARSSAVDALLEALADL
jgi:acetyl esterase/lipase